MTSCFLCPRKCGVDRNNNLGFCKSKNTIKLARASLHFGEEPVISSQNGSGTVFFSGCNLSCVYCQNSKISHKGFGKEVTSKELREIFISLIKKGADNINLVTPTHFIPFIKEALTPKLETTVIYNCGGYESVEALKSLEGLIDVYMPDMKYSIDALALKYSNVKDYKKHNLLAIEEMYRQVGDVVISKNGLIKNGVIVRHLILPGNILNSKGVISDFKKLSLNRKMLFSLMAQYTPILENLNDFPELCRPITLREYNSIVNYLYKSEIKDGFIQEFNDAVGEKYIPDFDLSGI